MRARLPPEPKTNWHAMRVAAMSCFGSNWHAGSNFEHEIHLRLNHFGRWASIEGGGLFGRGGVRDLVFAGSRVPSLLARLVERRGRLPTYEHFQGMVRMP